MQQEITINTKEIEITITSNETLQQATSILSSLNKQLDAIIEDKERLTKPLNASLKAIRDKYRPYETELSNAIATIRDKMTEYATSEAKRLKAQEEKIMQDKRTNIDTKIEKLATLQPTNEKVITDNGSLTFVTVKHYKIIDIQAIPRDFLTVDEAKVKEAMKENQPITGIEYYETKEPRNYRK